jgi:8-oxo-dGTP pyrophosphatase MutT (NUDIX family)
MSVNERSVVRLVVLDSHNCVLLLHVRDLSNPAFGTGWELPGGGMEPGESHIDAAIRELREETGIVIGASAIGPATWRRDVSFSYRGERRLQHEVIAAARLGHEGPAIERSPASGFEAEDLFELRWWTLDAIAGFRGDEWFYPRSLPVLLPRFLAGEWLEESLEIWP